MAKQGARSSRSRKARSSATARGNKRSSTASSRPKHRAGTATETDDVKFTNLDRVVFPEPGYTKGDVLDFYREIAPRLLPHLRDRPITVQRDPDGLAGPAPMFWQKNTPGHYPPWIPRVELPSERGEAVQYALVNDLRTLLYFVNQGTLTFHVWFSRVQDLDRPDFVLFDLDPGGAKFTDVVKIANALHRILDGQKVKHYPKTSGKSGLHILVPWTRRGGYDEAREWAMENARRVIDELPDIATVERSKAEREGRVYVDVMQNARGHHAVPPYVVRATPGATVSTPLDWKEVNARLDPKRFDIRSVFARFKKQRTDPMAKLAAS